MMPDMERFDVILAGGSVIDGSGGDRVQADVGIVGDRIAEIGDLSAALADERVDVSGKIVAPGFVDVHTHDDRLLFVDPAMRPKTSQGVTTVVVGNCGVSLAPFEAPGRPKPPLDLIFGLDPVRFPTFASFMDQVDKQPAAANAVFLVGHQTLRISEVADLDRTATDSEIAAMRVGVAEAMEAGAAGFSTGLVYPPARAASTNEVVALAELVGAAGGLYATHLRNEGARLLESVEEALEIGRRADAPVLLSHHKAVGVKNHGMVKQSLPLIAEARKHQKVALDVYPYIASSTILLIDRLADATKVLITWSEPMPEATGRDLAELAMEYQLKPEAMVERLQPAGAIYFAMDEDDVREVIAFEDTMIGSDGIPHDEKPHPRLWGTFPRVLGHYVRDVGLLSLEEAVRRMTGVPAEVFGLKDRGLLQEGAFADIAVFDAGTIIDSANFDAPTSPAAGVTAVMTNGQFVWRNGEPTGNKPGRALRRGPDLAPKG
ncbi:MAG: N-acyl-D-amino-acid deacylase family protein [Alphaproteobacteria bacterium]